jgi:AraC family transcriptional regulator of adaptative response / DNA-3-methyladenine glycosylase II
VGYVAVDPAAAGEVLLVELSATLLPVVVPLLARLRRLFDLDTDPRAIAEHLGGDSVLGPLVARRRGLRVPGAADGFELALRAVLGQQVTVRGATTLAGRLARLVAEPLPGAPPAIACLPISAERLAGASLASVTGIGLPRARAECVLALARAVAGGELSELASDGPAEDPAAFGRRLRDLPGVGAWTAEYVVMRALHWPDAFPEGDIALRKAMGGLTPARLRAAAEAWRPWRAYAAQHLWAGLADSSRRSRTTR